MKININRPVEAEAKTLKIYVKCRDAFTASLAGADGSILADYEGYVPGFMPGEHHGDYLILDIDIDTGLITNWQKPTPGQIEGLVEKKEEA